MFNGQCAIQNLKLPQFTIGFRKGLIQIWIWPSWKISYMNHQMYSATTGWPKVINVYLKNLNYLEIRWYQSLPQLKCYCIPKNKRICLLSYQDSVLCQNIKVSCSQDEINLGNKTCTINCRIRLDSYQMSKHWYRIKIFCPFR